MTFTPTAFFICASLFWIAGCCAGFALYGIIRGKR